MSHTVSGGDKTGLRLRGTSTLSVFTATALFHSLTSLLWIVTKISPSQVPSPSPLLLVTQSHARGERVIHLHGSFLPHAGLEHDTFLQVVSDFLLPKG